MRQDRKVHAFLQSAISIVISRPFVNRKSWRTSHKLNRDKLLGDVWTDLAELFEAALVRLSVKVRLVDLLFAHLASSDSKLTTDTDGVTFGGSAPA
jgi:hypothetical protein